MIINDKIKLQNLFDSASIQNWFDLLNLQICNRIMKEKEIYEERVIQAWSGIKGQGLKVRGQRLEVLSEE